MPTVPVERCKNKHTTPEGRKEQVLSFLYAIVAFVPYCRFFPDDRFMISSCFVRDL